MTKLEKKYGVIITVIIVLLISAIILGSYAVILDNDVEVEPNTDLIYYLNVKYDGVDKEGVESNDSTTSEVLSGNIHVTDKIPDGLEFEDFLTTEDGTIGAVSRKDGATSCIGRVVDDTNDASVSSGTWNSSHTEYTYHGLHYNATNRTVTFSVKNLKAGCMLTVGIKTKTPSTVDDPATTTVEKRRDFYNFATAREDIFGVKSNTVHAYMGSDDDTMYNVSYEYTGTVPDGAPSLPNAMSYAESSSVGVAASPDMKGYTFSGWTSSDVTITNGLFVMPNKSVVLKGSFTKINGNKVTYKIEGQVPPGYVLPLEKEYPEGDDVNIDSLKSGDVVNGYRFLGWNTTDVDVLEDGSFVMPNKNVTITGKFEEIKYKVTYRFFDTVLPPSSDSLLPAAKSYKPGTKVKLETIDDVSGYKFLGWYKDDNFEMPEEDVIIYGEWMEQTGTFEPTIKKEIVDAKSSYKAGDTVRFKITVKNTASFPIKDVMIKDDLDGIVFESGTGYSIESKSYVKIASINSGASTVIYANYVVKSTDKARVKNVVWIKGALADNNYNLKDKEYKSEVEFLIKSKLEICKEVDGSLINNVFQFSVTENTGKYQTWVILNKDECQALYLEPATYKVKEIVPQEYEIKSISGSITSNNSDLVIEQGKNYKITYTNEFKRKGFMHSFGRIVNKIRGGVTG